MRDVVEIGGARCVVNCVPVVLFTVGRSDAGEGTVMSIVSICKMRGVGCGVRGSR